MKCALSCLLSFLFLAAASAVMAAAAELSGGDPLLEVGCLDVTKAPYQADPSGASDSTEAIQRAVNDARDRGLVCFFPEGTYAISDTISCQQEVSKLATPRHVDGGTQHYWPVQRPIVLLGSTRGKRPVLKLSKDAKGFDDPSKPKAAVWIWAQTWFDLPGKEEPQWGKEQANISFNHIFKGIDIDVRGHAGAIGIRHSGSQGSTLQDSMILAEGAYAGMASCCGQGGGTHNIDVIGGEYAAVLEPDSRFPLLNACTFKGQTNASIRYTKGGSQVPTLLVGCLLQPASDCAMDLTTERAYAGVSMVDCVVVLKPGSVVCKTKKEENLFLEDCYLRGANAVRSEGPKTPSPGEWTRVSQYSSHASGGVNLINGTESAGEIIQWEAAPAAPDYETVRRRHYPASPSFEDEDAVNVKAFGAKGDGVTDDSAAFREAIAAHAKIFVPKGDYRLSGVLQLGPKTQLFALNRSFTSIGGVETSAKRGRTAAKEEPFSLATPHDPHAGPGLWFLSVRGRIDWRCGRGTYMLSAGNLALSGHGGGRLYGVMAMGRPFLLTAIVEPAAFYALNVERVVSNPQSEIRDSSRIRLYYFKVEAGTIQRPNAGDANTPCRIVNSRDVRVYCMYGNVVGLEDIPMLELIDSEVAVCQLKAFRPGNFPHIRETWNQATTEIPSSRLCARFVRESPDKQQ